MTTMDIELITNQTARSRDLGEFEFAEAIEAAYRDGVWMSRSKVIDSTDYMQQPEEYRWRGITLPHSASTNNDVKLIRMGSVVIAVVSVSSGESATTFPAKNDNEPIIRSSVVREFSQGIGGDTPTKEKIRMADQVVQVCREYTDGAHVYFDDEDGCLDFHLRLRNGYVVMANIYLNGDIDASVYDDHAEPVELVKRLRRGQTSGEDLIELFKSSGHTGSTG